MKNYMQPKGVILRDYNTSENASSPYPNSSHKQTRSLRKQKSFKENAPPSDGIFQEYLSPSVAAKTLSSVGKMKSPLPPRPPSSNSNPLKRKLVMETVPENSYPGSYDSGVQVIVRMRPPNVDEGEMIVQKVSAESLSILGHTFTFDSVADTASSQQDIFQLVGAPLVENCLAGFNSSIFAYGQTGSGKTYTMWGPSNALVEENASSNQQGLTPRVFEQLFARMKEEEIKHADKQLKYHCRCSFLEIYNEQITDLLDPSQRNLQIREDVKSGVYVENLTEEDVCTMKDVKHLLVKGLSNRRIGATSINAESSRSHSVFTCVVESRCQSSADTLSSFKISRINLVDLAGSERQKLTGAAGERLKEAGNINRSLSQLGNLINILAEVSQSGKQRHIPYRDSRLTFLLQESLGGNARLAMICAISPAQSCKSETFSTLRFAQRAKSIKNKAVVNEVMQDDVNVLREVIRQLKDELLRMKANANNRTDANGGYTTSWNARRSLNILKMSLNRPTLPHIEDDSDEEMEIDEEAVERLCVEVEKNISERVVGGDSSQRRSLKSIDRTFSGIEQPNDPSESACGGNQGSEEADVTMEDCQVLEAVEVDTHDVVIDGCIELTLCTQNNEVHPGIIDGEPLATTKADPLNRSSTSESIGEKVLDGGLSSEVLLEKPSELVGGVYEAASVPDNILTCSPSSVFPSNLSIPSSDVSPVLHSPTFSVSPLVNESRKSLRTSSMLSASQKNLAEDKKLSTEDLHLSFERSPKSNSPNAFSTSSKNCPRQSDNLAESIYRGLEMIDSHHKSAALGRSSFRFSYKPTDLKPLLPVDKVDVGIQTLPQDFEEHVISLPQHSEEHLEDLTAFLCQNCKSRTPPLELKEENDNSNLQLVPVEVSQSAEKSKKQVPKAVEKVLAGAIRREMALEEFCAKQTAEIMQLNRLVQQYKHERECNAIIEQTKEDKIIRLESLMDGVLPTEEFMEDELLSLTNEHKLLKEKYENHPELLRTKIELRRVQDELDSYKNFFDMGEKDVLLEEIQHLRSQLHYYVDSSASPLSSRRRSPLLQLTYPVESTPAPLCSIPESTEQNNEEKVEQSIENKFEQSIEEIIEQERCRWTEEESKWISLTEELRIELEATRSLAEKQKVELDSEKKCSEELTEAMRRAMQGHARILEQYADLQEKHLVMLARQRRMQEGIEDVKKAAAKAGVRGAESKFINSLASQISALRVEREKEKRYFMDEKKGLQAQLRDTAEAVQAAGELLVRLKEAEEVSLMSQKRAVEAENEADKAYKQIAKLTKKHEKEISTLNQFLAESRLPKEAIRPVQNDTDMTIYDGEDQQHNTDGDQQWREEFESFYPAEEDTDVSKLTEPFPWFSGYDRCNI